MDRSSSAPTTPIPEPAALLGLLLVGTSLTIAVLVSPVPWRADPLPGLWAGGALIAAIAAAWRPHLGTGALVLAALVTALRPMTVDPNAVAGALAPTAPIVVSWMLASRSGSTRWAAAILLVMLGTRLAATGSRGGLAALVVGGCVLTVLGVGADLRRRLVVGTSTVALSAIAAAWAWPAAARRLADGVLRPGEADGWSWSHLLTGRPILWEHAVEMLRDLPRWGIGPGRFDDVLLAYPLPSGIGTWPGDAHQTHLQHALDLGIPGASIALALTFLGLLRVTRSALDAIDGSSRRWLRAGLAGGFVGALVFGLADGLPLGSPEAVVPWSLLGLALSSDQRPVHRPMRETVGPVLLMLGVGLAGWWATAPSAQLDRVCRGAVRAIVGHGEVGQAGRALDAIASRQPRTLWLRGVLDAVTERAAERDAAWSRLVAATPERLDLLATVAPRHAPLARFAARRWPTTASSWRWLAGADPDSARPALRRALALDPGALDAAEIWLALGRLDERAGARRAALDAYAHACRTGDPGANACGAAGRLADAVGESHWASTLYRQSRWPDIRALADRDPTDR